MYGCESYHFVNYFYLCVRDRKKLPHKINTMYEYDAQWFEQYLLASIYDEALGQYSDILLKGES